MENLVLEGMEPPPPKPERLDADGFPVLPNQRTWKRLIRQIDNLIDLCDHPVDMPKDGTTRMTSTRGFWAPGPDGGPRCVGLSLITCPDCRPLVERAIDQATGGHDDHPWPSNPTRQEGSR